jgi:hypothetical protein
LGILIIVLRVIHIFSGVFWVGFAFFNYGFLQPTVKATGAEGQKTMQYLTQKTRLLSAVYATATLTMLSGLILYWIFLGFRFSAIFQPDANHRTGNPSTGESTFPGTSNPDAGSGKAVGQSRTSCDSVLGNSTAGNVDSAIHAILDRHFIKSGRSGRRVAVVISESTG